MQHTIQQEKDNARAKAHPEEIQQMYLMSEYYTAKDTTLHIPIMKHFYKEQLKPNTLDDIHRWWEVIDRTEDNVISTQGV